MTEPKLRTTVACHVGAVVVGGGAPVVVQSMTNTDTADAAGTTKQVAELALAGSEIVRITVNNRAAATKVASEPRRRNTIPARAAGPTMTAKTHRLATTK